MASSQPGGGAAATEAAAMAAAAVVASQPMAQQAQQQQHPLTTLAPAAPMQVPSLQPWPAASASVVSTVPAAQTVAHFPAGLSIAKGEMQVDEGVVHALSLLGCCCVWCIVQSLRRQFRFQASQQRS